jgi:hypothetical protein
VPAPTKKKLKKQISKRASFASLAPLAGLSAEGGAGGELADDDAAEDLESECRESLGGETKFDAKELVGLRLLFSLLDRSCTDFITIEDLAAYAEETGMQCPHSALKSHR